MASGRKPKCVPCPNCASNGLELVEGRFNCLRIASSAFRLRTVPADLTPVMRLIEMALRMVPTLSNGTPIVYMLRLRSGALYVGCSTDLQLRFQEHENGSACRTTRLDPPAALIFLEVHTDFRSARQRESQIKRWSRGKKLALARQNYALLSKLSESRD